MVDLEWLTDGLCDVVRWQLAHPDAQDEPDAPEIPWAGQRVWRLFLSLHATRGGGMGPSAITYADMEAYSRMTGEPIRPFEIEMIRAMDGAWLKGAAERQGRPEQPRVAEQPMTPQLFRAMFSSR